MIQIAERGQRPYRIRRTNPTHAAPSLTDEAFTAVIQSRGIPLDRGQGAGVVVENTARDVLARFSNPPGGGPEYQGVVACRWTQGHVPDPSDAGLVGVLTEHAVALVHRERTTAAFDGRDVAPHVVSALNAAQRVAAAAGILTALYHLTPGQSRQLLERVSDHTHRPVLTVADTVLRTGVLPSGRRHPTDSSGPTVNPDDDDTTAH